jgi:hypothetical protein
MSLEQTRATIKRTAMVGSPAKDKRFVEVAIEAICLEWTGQRAQPSVWQADQLLVAVAATAAGAYAHAIERVHAVLESPDDFDERLSAISVDQIRRSLAWLHDAPVFDA